MVFENFDTAVAYRKAAVNRKGSCPNIILMQEKDFLDSTGFTRTGGEKERNIGVFGQLPVHETNIIKERTQMQKNVERFARNG